MCALSVGAISRPVNPDSVAITPEPVAVISDSSLLRDDSSSAGRLKHILKPQPVGDSIASRRLIAPASRVDLSETIDTEEAEDSIALAPLSAISDSITGDSATIASDSVASLISRHTYTADTTRRHRLSRTRVTAPEKESKIVRSKVDLDNTVDFSAKDSLVLLGRNTAYMYGSSHVEYGTLKLDAQEIQMDLDNSNVYAVGGVDSVGEEIGRAHV